MPLDIDQILDRNRNPSQRQAQISFRGIREREIDCVLGNHDHYVTLLMDARLERLRPDVRQAVEWTQAALPMEDLRWLAELPRRLDYEELTIVHGSFGPKPWAYLVNEAALAENFKHQDVPLGFCGHSHVPMLSYNREADAPFIHYFENGPLPDESRVIVNVGAVGQPRDHDPRAACVIYELESRTLHLVRVPYDIAETQELMRQAGLPEKFITRLELGR